MADEGAVGTELAYEDERVRVWRIDLQPGEVAPLHTHSLDYTSVVIEGDVVERLNADGTVDRLQVQPGGFMRWHQGSLRHGLRNVGSVRFRNVIVELKDVPAG
jgi:quercetin dioxygenase-like cupin family protein